MPQLQQEREHWARDCKSKGSHKKDSIKGNLAMMAIDSSVSIHPSTWIAGSGSSAHITPNAEWIDEYRTLRTPLGIRIGDNTIIQAIGSGRIITTMSMINNVYHVPEAGANLFSVSSATENGLEMKINSVKLSLISSGRTVLEAPYVNGLYLLDLDLKVSDKTMMLAATMDDWHERLGHPSVQTIERMVQDKIVDRLKILKTKDGSNERCVHCAENKCTKASHRPRTSEKANRPGTVLHMDTAGPSPKEGLNGFRWFILVKDAYSSYKVIRPIASKAEIPNTIKQIISMAELETKNKVLQIVSDQGYEFDNTFVEIFLQDRGINHRYSATYTPQQNGFIEREIHVRTVKEAYGTILDKSGLGEELWDGMIQTAVYLLNKIPNSRTGNKTP